MRACRSLPRIVAWHVLPRHVAPRHSPEALCSFRSLRPCGHTSWLAPPQLPASHPKGSPSGGRQEIDPPRCRLVLKALPPNSMCSMPKDTSFTTLLYSSTMSLVRCLASRHSLCRGTPRAAVTLCDRSAIARGSILCTDQKSRPLASVAPFSQRLVNIHHVSAAVKGDSKATFQPSLVEANGLEPMTSCLQSRRSPN